MSEASEVLHLLQRVARRARLAQYLRIVLLLATAGLFAAVIGRVFALIGSSQPALWAVLVLVGLLGATTFALLLARELVRGRCNLTRAAAMVDARGELKDEISSAFWFMNQQLASDWVRHHIERAARTARNLDVVRLLPLGLPRIAWAAAAFAGLLMALQFTHSLLPAMAVAEEATPSNDAQAQKAKHIRALLKQTTPGEAARKLEEALAAHERKNATEEEKRKALADAKEAVDKSNMEMNSVREGLMQLAERLRNTREKSSADDKNPDRADRAKELLDRMLDQKGRPPHAAELDAESLAREKELEKLLEQAAKANGGTSDGQHFESAQPKAVVDRLEKIAQTLEQQTSANAAVRELSQMQQLQVSQTSIQSAGRYSNSQPSQTPPTGTPSPDSGNTVMSGGIMFRTAAVARGDKPTQTQEGSKSGAAAGDSQADPVLGKKEKALAVQLKKEGIRKEGQEGETGAEGWFYAESRAQSSQIALQAVRANTRYTQADAMDPEHISVKHRQVVKDYFLNLHEKPREAAPQ